MKRVIFPADESFRTSPSSVRHSRQSRELRPESVADIPGSQASLPKCQRVCVSLVFWGLFLKVQLIPDVKPLAVVLVDALTAHLSFDEFDEITVTQLSLREVYIYIETTYVSI